MLNHKVCWQGIHVSSFPSACFLQFASWHDSLSVARWLWPKSDKWCHKKLLDSVKRLVTNFQLKSAKSNEILSKNLSFFIWLKETYTAIFVKPQQRPTPSESIAIYCVRKLVSCVTHLQSCAKVDIWNKKKKLRTVAKIKTQDYKIWAQLQLLR